jgi:hypothetical protein
VTVACRQCSQLLRDMGVVHGRCLRDRANIVCVTVPCESLHAVARDGPAGDCTDPSSSESRAAGQVQPDKLALPCADSSMNQVEKHIVCLGSIAAMYVFI